MPKKKPMAKPKAKPKSKAKPKVKPTAIAVVDDTPVIDVDRDIMQLSNGKKLSLMPVSQMPLNKTQILTLLQRTPPQHVLERPGKGGGTFQYVSGVYVKKVLNYVFGFNWEFEIISEEEKYSQIVVQGKLTVHDGKGHSVSKMQYGRADIKMKKGTKIPMDYGNDKKASATDCLKKCASEFGIASDIYGAREFKELGVDVNDNLQTTKTDNQTQPTPNSAPKTSTPEKRTGSDYCNVLKGFVLKKTKNEAMTSTQIIKWVNDQLGSNFTNTLLTNQGLAQRTIARLMHK